jgi:UDP-glucose 4-epimerase
MSSTTSHVLITGGLGYVGGRLATYLNTAAPGISVRLMTRRGKTRLPAWANSLDVAQADLLDQGSLDAALSGIDTVVHLAAVNEIESQRDPDLALEVNGRGTFRLLEACRTRTVNRFIYLSTFHVYGPGVSQPITEESATRPVHPYAITHRLAEDFVNWYRYSHGLATLILRLSNGYGYPADPGVQRWTLVFNDLCMQAVQNGEIKLKSRGTQHRDFISLTDVGRAIHHFLSLSNHDWRDGLFNLGGECSMSILQVAQRVAAEFLQRFGKEIPIITGSEEGGSPSPVSYSIDKLKQTGFFLKGNMSEEVGATFDLCDTALHQGSRIP